MLSQLGYSLLTDVPIEVLEEADQNFPDDRSLAFEIAAEAQFLSVLPSDQIELYADFLVSSGGGESFRQLLKARLAGGTLSPEQFQFMDGFIPPILNSECNQ